MCTELCKLDICEFSFFFRNSEWNVEFCNVGFFVLILCLFVGVFFLSREDAIYSNISIYLHFAWLVCFLFIFSVHISPLFPGYIMTFDFYSSRIVAIHYIHFDFVYHVYRASNCNSLCQATQTYYHSEAQFFQEREKKSNC